MISGQPWGSVGGQPIDLFTLSSGAGMTAAVATYGGVVQSVRVPDRAGRPVDVVLGFDSLDRYLDRGAAEAFFGAIIGRYANRIAGHSFVLDGRRHELAHAPGDTVTLHGGPGGYNTRVWQAAAPARVGGRVVLRLSHVDPDGENGFPGTVRSEVVYAVTPDNALRIEYRVRCDAATVVNLTNHTYFNLAGEASGDVYSQLLAVNADVFQPVDETQIPVGFAGVSGTPFDFRTMKPIGRDIRSVDQPWGEQLALARGYDHNCVVSGAGYRLAAVAWDPGTGIVLSTYTDQPGLQLYTGNHLTGELVGAGGRAYGEGSGFALETQRFPDAPNHIGEPGWPSAVLRPGQVLRTRTTYKFGVAGSEVAERIRF
ncbi:MAG: galactose mutarotase [Mycobacteriaceae bacterium]|nr:galactose mutarotase [Mycobacteriaceae bacterium]